MPAAEDRRRDARRHLTRETVDFVANYDSKGVSPRCSSVAPAEPAHQRLVRHRRRDGDDIPPQKPDRKSPTPASRSSGQAGLSPSDELIDIVPAPDFPTAGIIYGPGGRPGGYRTGRERVVMRAHAHRGAREGQPAGDRHRRDPYQVNSRTCSRPHQRARARKEDRRDLGYPTNRTIRHARGHRKLKREVARSSTTSPSDAARGQLRHEHAWRWSAASRVCSTSNGSSTSSCSTGAREVGRAPDALRAPEGARARAHPRGLAIRALSNVDEIIALIKAAASPGSESRADGEGVALAARRRICGALQRSRASRARLEFGWHARGRAAGYHLSDTQAQAILELHPAPHRPRAGTRSSANTKVMARIVDYLRHAPPPRLCAVTTIIQRRAHRGPRPASAVPGVPRSWRRGVSLSWRTVAPRSRADPRRRLPAEIAGGRRVSRAGPVGGRGKRATATKEDDFVERMFMANTHDHASTCFSNRGRVCWLWSATCRKAADRSRAKPIDQPGAARRERKINAILPVRSSPDPSSVFIAHQSGAPSRRRSIDAARGLHRGRGPRGYRRMRV